MEDLKWLDYDGCPHILMEKESLNFWNGAYIPVEDSVELPDLELKSGKFNIHDEFDFENPVTDYDKVCAPEYNQPIQEFELRQRQKAILFSTEKCPLTWVNSMKCFAWFQSIKNISGKEEDLEQAKKANHNWSNRLSWKINSNELVLFNSFNHGLDPEMGAENIIEFTSRTQTVTFETTPFSCNNSTIFLVRMSDCLILQNQS